MARTLLIPLDGSEHAEKVIPHACNLARATNRTLTLMQVIAAPDDVERVAMPDHRRRSLLYLAYIADMLRAKGFVVQTSVVEGDPAARIVEWSIRHIEDGMIAMTTHGRRGPARWLFGSVAEDVLHAAMTPLLLVRAYEQVPDADPVAPYRTILVPLDGSCFSCHAVDQARDLARTGTAALHLLAVVAGGEPPASADDTAAADTGVTPTWMMADAYAHAQSVVGVLNRTAQQLHHDEVPVRTTISYGSPVAKIIQTATSIDADLVVMATHGRIGMQRALFGSVALDVLQRIDRPVLLVRPH